MDGVKLTQICYTFDNCHAFKVHLVRCFGSLKERSFKNPKCYFATTTPHNFFTNAHFKLKTLFSNSLYRHTISLQLCNLHQTIIM